MSNQIDLHYETESVAVISLNRPELKDSIGIQMAAQFAEILDEISRNEHIRALIITGEGQEAFSTGTDLEE